ncbi:hypothetical protein sp82g_185 [Bacillus phage SP82G]|uniref:Uncharacterized protein n=1 Tax=Bacillus phage vB_BsuM-Goe2 TaxID=1933062 RepID=A0A1Z1D9F9_9CAUD|nr:hypothetical protein Goe2_c16900 [Bacillus phage vB_BsuM-Goe2]UNY49122.1 hypothetical protein sp82g_185 [Bacillus phage SP82G]
MNKVSHETDNKTIGKIRKQGDNSTQENFFVSFVLLLHRLLS